VPNIKSSIKRVRTTRIKTAQNKTRRSELRTVIRNYNKALVSNADNKEELLKLAIKKVDKAAAKKLIHKNTASRKKSQLMKAYNTAQVSE